MTKFSKTGLIFTIITAFITIIGVEAALSQLMMILEKDFQTILTVNLIYWVVIILIFLLLIEVFKDEKRLD